MGGFSEQKFKNEILNPAGAISESGVRKVNFCNRVKTNKHNRDRISPTSGKNVR